MNAPVSAMCSVKNPKQAKPRVPCLLAEDEAGVSSSHLAIYLSFCWIWDLMKMKVLHDLKGSTV